MKRKFWSSKDKFLPLQNSPVLGESYHVSWASNGVIGICIKIYEKERLVELARPKIRKSFSNLIPFDELRHTRKQQERIESGLTPYPNRTNDLQFQKRLRKFKLI